ncbi:hypothetical protein WMY93_011910 [Mugilogobius chulae]|uniref:Uncharacterized protein n=1 Tax=Mugilogobius chulae TaxID=88201 RepID=A0AAW0PCS8_9GOBI
MSCAETKQKQQNSGQLDNEIRSSASTSDKRHLFASYVSSSAPINVIEVIIGENNLCDCCRGARVMTSPQTVDSTRDKGKYTQFHFVLFKKSLSMKGSVKELTIVEIITHVESLLRADNTHHSQR